MSGELGRDILTITESPTQVGSGVITVAAHGVRQPFPNVPCRAVSIVANPNNAGLMYLGGATVAAANGRVLGAGASIDMLISNLNLLYVDSASDGDSVSYLWLN